MYPLELTRPMALDLEEFGFTSLKDGSQVTQALQQNEGTSLLVVNSVCGCAAANARPGVKMAIKHGQSPQHLYTVFAGVDQEATAVARNFLLPYPPSSPAIALFKDGELVYMMERHQIEGQTAHTIAQKLVEVFDEHCN